MRVLTLLLLFGGLLSPQSAPPDAWPQFRGNPQLSGVSASEVPRNLKVLWSVQAGEVIESSPAIVDGVVYVGTGSGDLLALNLSDGKTRWKYQVSGTLGVGESSPAVAGGVVYVGDLEGVVHAVDARSGKGLWTHKTATEIKASPVVAGDRVLIGSYDQNLYCLNARTGAVVWQVQTEGPVHGTPGVLDGMTYASGCDGQFRVIRISDGKEMFQIPAGAYTGASPALSGSSAYFGTFNNEVLGVDLRGRKIAWKYEHPQRKFPFYSSAAIVGDKIVVGGRDKMVHCLNASTGKALWTFVTRAKVDSSPAVAGDRVFVGSNDGRFYVLNLKDGAKLWEFNAGAGISASPAIAGGRIVVGAQDGRLYCFGS